MTYYYKDYKHITIVLREEVISGMKKTLFSILFTLGLLVVLPQVAIAHENTDEGTLRHAYRPVVVEKTNAMRARVDNFSTDQQTRLVCVEAFNTVSGQKTHLGCLKVNLDSYNSAGQWAFEFDAPTYWLQMGNYNVVYTYQGTDGAWHHVKSINMQVTDGMYMAR